MPGLVPDDDEDDLQRQRLLLAQQGGIVPGDDQDQDASQKYAQPQTDPTTEDTTQPAAGLSPAPAEDENPQPGLAPFDQPNDSDLKAALAVPGGTQSTIGQEKLTAGSQMAQGPRPTDPNAVPGAHHGWRKAGDVAAAIGMGALTMNPMAGLGTYQMLNRAPLRKAQAGFDAQQNVYDQNMKNLKQIESGEQGEQRINALNNRLSGLTAERDARAQKDKEQGQKFVAGSEQQDPNSPTGWTAQTLAGERKPYTPKKIQKTQDEIIAERQTQAKKLGLDADDTKFYVLNGKLKEPAAQTNIHLPNAEASEYQDWKSAYKAEHGKDPDAKAIEGYKRGVKADTTTAPYMRSPEAMRDHYENAAHGEYSVLQKEYDAARAKAVKANIDDQKAMQTAVASVDADFASRKSKIDEKKAADAQKFGQNVQPSDYSYINGGGGQKPAAAVQPAPVRPQPAAAPPIVTPVTKQQVKIGQQVSVGGKPMYVTGFNPQTGKPKVSATPPNGN